MHRCRYHFFIRIAVIIFMICPGLGVLDVYSGDTGPISALNAQLAWTYFDGQDSEIFYAHLQNDLWTSGTQLTDDHIPNIHPALSSGIDGVTWVVWVDVIGSESSLSFCNFIGNAWTPPKRISTGLTSNVAPSIIIDADNIPWIVWAGFDGQDDDIFYSKWNGSNWNTPLRVNQDDATPDILPIIAMDGAGNPYIYWIGYSSGTYNTYFSKWNGKEWEYETEVGNDKFYISAILDKVGRFPSLPDFVSEPDKASIHIRKGGAIQSIPFRYLSNISH